MLPLAASISNVSRKRSSKDGSYSEDIVCCLMQFNDGGNLVKKDGTWDVQGGRASEGDAIRDVRLERGKLLTRRAKRVGKRFRAKWCLCVLLDTRRGRSARQAVTL